MFYMNTKVPKLKSELLINNVHSLMEGISLSQPHGVAGKIVDELAQYEQRPIKELRPLVALSVLSMVNYNKECYEGGNLHFQGLGIALSSSGKEAHISFIKLILEKLGFASKIANKPRSDKNIYQDVINGEHLLYLLDEVHSLFNQGLKKNSSSFESGMISVFLEIFTSEKFYIPSKIKKELFKEYKNTVVLYQKKQTLTIKQQALLDKYIRIIDRLENGWRNPYLSFVGYSTPINLDMLINKVNIEQGLIGRFIILKGPQKRGNFTERKIKEPSDQLISNLNKVLASNKKITMSPIAKTTLKFIFEYFELDEHLNHPQLGAIYARGVKWVLLISSLLASETCVISDKDICYATKLFLYNINSCKQVLNNDGELEDELLKNANEIALRYVNKGPIQRSVLASKLTNCSTQIKHYKIKNKDICYLLIDKLINNGDLHQENSTIYRAINNT